MKVYQATREPIWPYIGVVSCLFVLSVVAARSWKPPATLRVAESKSETEQARLEKTAAELGAASMLQPSGEFATRSFAPPVLRNRDLASPTAQSAWDLLTRHHSLPDPLTAGKTTTPDTTSQPITAVEPAAQAEASPSDMIETLVLPSQRARLAPPVATRVEVEPPVAEMPAEKPVTEVERQIAGTPAEEPVTATAEPSPSTEIVSQSAPRLSHEVAEEVQPRRSALERWVSALREDERFRELADEVDLVLHELDLNEDTSLPSYTLARLGQLGERAAALARSVESIETRSKLLRLSYAIQRRRAIWEQVNLITANSGYGFVSVGLHDIEDVVGLVEKKLGNSGVADGWRNYLRLKDLLAANASGDPEQQRQLARTVLERLNSADMLTEQQRKYLAQPPFTELGEGLARWSREPLNYARLIRVLEEYENERGAEQASELAKVVRAARWDGQRPVAKLAKLLDTHYRNANLRVATSSELINRLLPQPQAAEEEIDEFILGACVTGTSRTKSNLRVVLVPDDRLWRMRLEARGSVETSTSASKGPATFYNDGFSEFSAQKTLLIDHRGVKVELAKAAADSESELTGFQTQYDTVPVVGLLARAIARQQHDERYFDAQVAAEARLEERARERLDQEVHFRLDEIEREFDEKVLQPFNAMRLRPKALDMHTTDRRVIIRYRLAGGHQLAAHTPRPQAPSDSLLSVQLHETVLNNMVGQLKLEGTREDLRHMYRRLAVQFGQSDMEVPDDIPEGITIQFANREAIRFRFEDNQVTLTVRIAELSNGRRSWRNFAVRAHYIPDPTQLEANLVRDSYIELASQSRLGLGDQIALRGIFSKVFAKSRPVRVVNDRLERHPKMSDLQVTQFTVMDGWIGVAIGPQRETEVLQVAESDAPQVRL